MALDARTTWPAGLKKRALAGMTSRKPLNRKEALTRNKTPLTISLEATLPSNNRTFFTLSKRPAESQLTGSEPTSQKPAIRA